MLWIEIGYSSISTGGKLAFFFNSIRNCLIAPTTKYSLADRLCYDVCPGRTYTSGSYCLKCNINCRNCTAASSSSCSACDASLNRGLAGSSCNCITGFIETNVALCPPCSNYIPNCLACSLITSCTNCMSIFVFNPISFKCECPALTYYVPASLLCAPFPGCTLA